MTAGPLCFIDVEATGLDPRIHQPYEVAWWYESGVCESCANSARIARQEQES